MSKSYKTSECHKCWTSMRGAFYDVATCNRMYEKGCPFAIKEDAEKRGVYSSHLILRNR